MLALLAFNWFGYRLLISLFEHRANERFQTELDNNSYDSDELISIKIPVTSLAYYTNAKLFERVDGQVEIKGILYNYVKQRVYNDSLEMLCIPNTAMMILQTEKNDLLKSVNDIQQPEQGKKAGNHTGNTKNFSQDHYTVQDFIALTDLFGNARKKSFYFSLFTSFPYCAEIEYPPEHFSFL
jgi:hypothetical protein